MWMKTLKLISIAIKIYYTSEKYYFYTGQLLVNSSKHQLHVYLQITRNVSQIIRKVFCTTFETSSKPRGLYTLEEDIKLTYKMEDKLKTKKASESNLL